MMTDHGSRIRALRAQSNAAIARRDAAQVVGFMLPGIRVQVAAGPLLVGREASREAFAAQFADRAFRGYVREAEEVTVHEGALHATERGRWTGRWGRGVGEEVMRGGYVAEWKCSEVGWFIESERYFPLA